MTQPPLRPEGARRREAWQAEAREAETREDGAGWELSWGDEGRRRDPAAVLRFIERFASNLVEVGMPRMPSRVFVTLLASDSGRLTAAEIGEVLQISPAAVSGAVRYLMQVQLVSREREPGSRRDYYRVHDDVWHDAVLGRDQLFAHWDAVVREGVEALGARTPAGQRLELTREYFRFLREQLPTLITEWRQRRAKLREKAPGGE